MLAFLSVGKATGIGGDNEMTLLAEAGLLVSPRGDGVYSQIAAWGRPEGLVSRVDSYRRGYGWPDAGQ